MSEGTDTVQLSDRDGKVVMHFQRPVEWVALDPQTAGKLAEAMSRASYKATFGDVPTPQKTQIVDVLRVRLVRMVEIMLGSFDKRAPRPHPKVQATEIVDRVLQEVT